jgi:hypothetical protein
MTDTDPPMCARRAHTQQRAVFDASDACLLNRICEHDKDASTHKQLNCRVDEHFGTKWFRLRREAANECLASSLERPGSASPESNGGPVRHARQPSYLVGIMAAALLSADSFMTLLQPTASVVWCATPPVLRGLPRMSKTLCLPVPQQ